LFALTILLLFFFALGEVDKAILRKIFVAETYLALFLALESSFSRAFEPDTKDNVFDLLRTYPLSPYGWFLSKLLIIFAMGVIILLPTVLISLLFHGSVMEWSMIGPFLLIALLALAGLAALGVFLSSLMLGLGNKQILYPLLYFPLTAPVLLAASQASLSLLSGEETLATMVESWLGLLMIFDTMYLVLGMVLFDELVKPES
jgi:ABC-type transport system involved in cytochrome c biogenesis permease component